MKPFLQSWALPLVIAVAVALLGGDAARGPAILFAFVSACALAFEVRRAAADKGQ